MKRTRLLTIKTGNGDARFNLTRLGRGADRLGNEHLAVAFFPGATLAPAGGPAKRFPSVRSAAWENQRGRHAQQRFA